MWWPFIGFIETLCLPTVPTETFRSASWPLEKVLDHLWIFFIKPHSLLLWLQGLDLHSSSAMWPFFHLFQYLHPLGVHDDKHLWNWPDSHKVCFEAHVAPIHRRVIDLADPGNSPLAHQVLGYADTLASLRTFSASKVQKAGQWACGQSFVDRYLLTNASDMQGVAMSVPPSLD